jgi:amidase
MGDVRNLETWQEKAAAARAQRDATLTKVQPALEGLPTTAELPLDTRELPKSFLTARELEITEQYTITELLAALRERKISVEEVTRAFLRRAVVAHAATNCLTELLWDRAIERAKYLDSLPEPKGMLFGLPISTKEHQGMVGSNITSNASCVAWIGKQHGSNMLYDSMWNEGCVFYARTNQPQAIFHLETNNNVYGRTLNPYNRNLSPGGSTGGESALLGMRGSILGIGGDIGGSIRLPAAHVGLYGFKPTWRRISARGLLAPSAGKETMGASPGPLAPDRDAMELLMKVALAAKPWRIDPAVIEKPWTPYGKFTQGKRLKVAVQWWDGVVMPHPPMTRALREVADACRKAGMEVVDWNCEDLDHQKAWDIVSALYFPDGGKEIEDLCAQSGEPLLPLTKWLIHEQPTVKHLTQHELWKLCLERDNYKAFYAQAWSATGKDEDDEVDVILCPPCFGAATPHDQSKYWGYTSQWNLLDYPGVVFPVTTVDPVLDVKDVNYTPKNEQDKFVYDMYSPETFANAPVSLQIVGRRLHDEKVLAALVEIERAMGRK